MIRLQYERIYEHTFRTKKPLFVNETFVHVFIHIPSHKVSISDSKDVFFSSECKSLDECKRIARKALKDLGAALENETRKKPLGDI